MSNYTGLGILNYIDSQPVNKVTMLKHTDENWLLFCNYLDKMLKLYGK